MAFILVQHLDPTHERMMVDLLAGHTSMTVRQATDGMPIEQEHLYIIPPGNYLSVGNGALHLSQPQARHGARLPFDFLLHSLAEACDTRAICVILSGTGADGSLGLRAVNAKGGFVVTQDPDEAGYDGMPRSAIATGFVNVVLPAAKIAAALIEHVRQPMRLRRQNALIRANGTPDWLSEIIDLLRAKTAHDFTLYKEGTLQRRIERRMAMASIKTGDANRYLEILRSDASELDLLAKDLLINVTGFFRDRQVFELLEKKIVPELVHEQPPGRPLRIWIAGCSTGEETYSLAMLFNEQITAMKREIKLQVFASDIDAEAVASAQDGLYSEAIAADISQMRLDRFFSKEDQGYRVSSELRASVIFTVQDVLADPPFSRLDFVSCRNLLIYLRPEAQAKVISLLHFALCEGGILLLGSAETIGDLGSRFEVISKSARLYRRIGRSRPGDLGFSAAASGSVRVPPRQGLSQAASRQALLADLCRRLVMESHAPATMLINRKQECLYSSGPVDRYLRLAPGHPAHDLLAMAREGVRTKLRSAVQLACQNNRRVIVAGGRTKHDGAVLSFSISVEPVLSEGEELLLVCFIDERANEVSENRAIAPGDATRVAELEQELEATRMELQGAIRSLETSSEEQQAINEEALSVNEEYQSTNEELLSSKEELQSLNEELTALNSQLQETLERQRTTSDDLQNVLYSTDVATLFLDTRLNIRFFTPATKSLFNIISSDVGRPLTDLSSLAADSNLPGDVQSVLNTLTPLEREIETQNGVWFIRRISPYRVQGKGIEGVVITFTDVSDRRRTAEALSAAKRQAELANVAKSRFLAAASHDLRQPLQTLKLLQGLLASEAEGEAARKLIARFDGALDAMSGMLNTLLDINQLEAGNVRSEMVIFPIRGLLDRLRDEFAYHAQAHGLTLRVVSCGLSIRSDPRLLEQMIRNLLANALKYTKQGRVLLGCRRRQGALSIEVWDTGIGIPDEELLAVFEEYHQLDNAAREKSRGLGLGLSIVQRLAKLLDHRVRVYSQPGKGSVFAIEAPVPVSASSPTFERHRRVESVPAGGLHHTGAILIVEDDPEMCGLLELLLEGEGHRTATAADGRAALALVARGTIQPDLILSDYNLPNGMDGLEVTRRLREGLHRHVAVVILTGDISTDTLRNITLQDCVQLSKPVKPEELTQVIRQLLVAPRNPAPKAQVAHIAEAANGSESFTVFVVDDDRHVRETLRATLEGDGRIVEACATSEAFLEAYRPGQDACLLIDAYLPGMSGLELLRRLNDAGHRLPAIMITGNSDVPMAVQAMKAGASDFIEKPIGEKELLASVARAFEQSRDSSKLSAWREAAAKHVADLTPRQRQIMDLVLAGHPSKNIAADLGISQRTVENHRASIMRKTGSKSLPALARLVLAAASTAAEGPSV